MYFTVSKKTSITVYLSLQEQFLIILLYLLSAVLRLKQIQMN